MTLFNGIMTTTYLHRFSLLHFVHNSCVCITFPIIIAACFLFGLSLSGLFLFVTRYLLNSKSSVSTDNEEINKSSLFSYSKDTIITNTSFSLSCPLQATCFKAVLSSFPSSNTTCSRRTYVQLL